MMMQSILAKLIAKAEKQHKHFPTAFDIEAIRKCKTFDDFDKAYTVKIYGFQDLDDYYRQCGSKSYLSRIRVPTFAINAIDDPAVDDATLPTEEDLGHEAPVRLIYHPHGGHCSFDTDRMSVEAECHHMVGLQKRLHDVCNIFASILLLLLLVYKLLSVIVVITITIINTG